MIAFGGAAPLHAARLAEKLDMDRILIPTAAAVGSAVGFLRAPVAYEVVRSAYQVVSAFNPETTNRVLEEMRSEAAAIVAQGAPGAATQEHRAAYMRYLGQGHEVVVPLPNRTWAREDTAIIRDSVRVRLRGALRPHHPEARPRDRELVRRRECRARGRRPSRPAGSSGRAAGAGGAARARSGERPRGRGGALPPCGLPLPAPVWTGLRLSLRLTPRQW